MIVGISHDDAPIAVNGKVGLIALCSRSIRHAPQK
jgi:hypothetical protein